MFVGSTTIVIIILALVIVACWWAVEAVNEAWKTKTASGDMTRLIYMQREIGALPLNFKSQEELKEVMRIYNNLKYLKKD